MIVQLLYFSDLLPNKYPEDAANLFAALEKHHVAYGFIKGAKDVRIRDFMPIQVRGRWPQDNVLFRYEPSYLKNRRDLQTVFLQNIDTNWQLVNGWRPPCDFDRFDKSEMRAKPTPLFMEEQRMKKEEFIRIRVAGWQKKYISLQAEKAHKSLSQYVRDAAMDKDVTVIDGVDDLICELRRQDNNLNQLVVMARQGHVELVNMEPFMEVYENTWQTLNLLLSRVG